MNMMMNTNFGKVGGELAESLAYLNSPAAIEGQIAYYEMLLAQGDRSPATLALLGDWRAIRDTQARLLGRVSQQQALDLAGAAH